MQPSLDDALRVTPGASQTRSKSPLIMPKSYPNFCIGGDGGRLKCDDARWYVDWMGALGANAFGYAHQAFASGLYSLPHVDEIAISRDFVDWVGQESVRWVKTGSEACAAAVRIARRATGRHLILTSDESYHGWHDWYTQTKSEHDGVPEDGLVRTFKAGDLDDLKRMFHVERPAAILMEAGLRHVPDVGTLREMRDLAHAAGALFILDEMILGCRIAYGGAREWYNITPDLACYGKAIGNGVPIACVTGSRELMQYADVISGTYGGDLMGLRAVRLVHDLWLQHGQAIADNGAAFKGLALNMNVPTSGWDARPFLDPSSPEWWTFISVCGKHGVLIHPSGGINPCSAHTPDDLEVTAAAMRLALVAIESGVRIEQSQTMAAVR